MADQNITELPVKTSSGITSSDYMLGIDSAEGYQMLIRDLGDYIIRNVQVNTIAGSNQTLKNALDTLNSNAIKHNLTIDQELANGTDLNTLTTPGSFICPNGAISQTLSNWPVPGNGGRLEVISILRTIGLASSERLRQIVFCNNAQDTYQRVWNGSSWSAWEKLPLRWEIDALNSKTTTIEIDSATTFTIPNNYRGVLFVTDSASNKNGEYMVFCTGTSAVGYKAVSAAEGITIDTSTSNKLILTPSSGTRNCLFLNIKNVATIN